MKVIALIALLAGSAVAQSWSNIIATSRAIDWTSAGLPATLSDGETTTNPWTPPTRTTQCVTSACNTLSGGTVTFASINAALASATNGNYVLVPAGTFTLNGTSASCSDGTSNVLMYSHNNVSLRGAGAQSTIINLGTGATAAQFCFGVAWSAATQAITSGATQGSTAIVVSAVSGANGLVAGQLITFTQCNTGLSGAGCATGTQTDNGGLFICAFSAACSQQTSGADVTAQKQTVRVTSITGSGPFTINFSPALRLPNWNGGATQTVSWTNTNNGGGVASPNGVGLEDMTINVNGNTTNAPLDLNNNYASWIKGVRLLGIGQAYSAQISGGLNCLFANNYIYAALGLGGNDNTMLGTSASSDSLVINNILTGGVPWEGQGSNSGNVIAYNFSRFANTSYYQDSMFEHHEGSSLHLYEGNQVPKINDDNTWGTHILETTFRNYLSGADPPFQIGGTTAFGLGIGAFSRFANAIGNAIGSSNLTNYQSTIASPQNTPVFEFNNGTPQDTLTETGFLRWGNCDTVTATCRNQSGEVPVTLSGNAVPYQNSVPGTNNLPCSFFLAGYTATTCTAHSSGGTGLNFWKVCTAWSSFPGSCSTTSIPPFPATGPDVSGGAYVNGTSYDIPAAIAFNNLPIDSAYQNSYSITSSSWSAGTEVLTVSGLPTSTHIIGGFQVTGVPACNTGAGAEFIMTASTSTTVSYALAGNPGSCAGATMKFPDVRQFDETVWQNDPAGGTNGGSKASGKITRSGSMVQK